MDLKFIIRAFLTHSITYLVDLKVLLGVTLALTGATLLIQELPQLLSIDLMFFVDLIPISYKIDEPFAGPITNSKLLKPKNFHWFSLVAIME